MITVTLMAGWQLLLPTDFKSLGKHAAAGVAYVSNLLLWTESGYFDAPSGSSNQK
jgi:peptidoglycan/LPS O-acetylase OafA/YrhL